MTDLAWYLAETGAALAVFYGLYWLTLKDDTHFQMSRLYLLASLVAAHLLPLVHVTSPFRQVVVPRLPTRVFDDMPVSQGLWDWQQVVLWVYAAGAVFLFVRLGWHLRHLLLVARQHPVVHRDGIRLIYVDEDCPPFSFFRTAFVHRPAAGDEQILDQVVVHERTHIRQGHSLDILLIQVVAIGQWFNPFIWLYKRALRELHEYLADREVLAQGFDPLTYRRILLEQRLGGRPLEFAHHLRQSQLKRRLAMMARRSGRWTVCKYLLAGPALALLVVAFADPRVTEAQGVTTIEPAAAPTPRPAAVERSESQRAQGDEGEVTGVMKTEAEHPKMAAALAEKPAAGSDQPPDFWDPVVLQGLLQKVSQETEALEAKSRDVTDPVNREDLQKELDNLAKKRAFLQARLAQMQKGK